jgi:hypothetical protein
VVGHVEHKAGDQVAEPAGRIVTRLVERLLAALDDRGDRPVKQR